MLTNILISYLLCHNDTTYKEWLNPSIISKKSMYKQNFGQTLKLQSAVVTLNIRSRSSKSNQLFFVTKECINASLVKIHPLVQKIMHRNEATRTPTGSTLKTICPPSLRPGGHNYYSFHNSRGKINRRIYIPRRRVISEKHVNHKT